MDFTALKTAIQNAIKLNGNEEITGDILQGVLLSMVSTLGDSAINDLVTAISNEATARQNGDSTLNGYITALQGAVNSINTAIGNGFVYAGIATPTTTPAMGKVFYIALTAGTYTNFGNTEVSQGINILKYDGSAWSLDVVIALDDAPTPSSNNLVKSGGVFDKVMIDGSAFDISAHFASGGTLATYADLSAALTALNTLSASYKKGGMSIKFVQSSDNMYVQYRLMDSDFTTIPRYWQCIGDDKFLSGSPSLTKSSEIFNKIASSVLNDKFEGQCELRYGTNYNPIYINDLTLKEGVTYVIKISSSDSITGTLNIKFIDENGNILTSKYVTNNGAWDGSEVTLTYTPEQTFEHCSVGSFVGMLNKAILVNISLVNSITEDLNAKIDTKMPNSEIYKINKNSLALANCLNYNLFDTTDKIAQGGVNANGTFNNLSNRIRINQKIYNSGIKLKITSGFANLNWFDADGNIISGSNSGWIEPRELTYYEYPNAWFCTIHFASESGDDITPQDFGSLGVELYTYQIYNACYNTIDKNTIEISDGFTLTAASASHLQIDSARGICYVTYISSTTLYTESAGRIMLTTFPINQPFRQKHYVVAYGNGYFESNCLLINDTTLRVFYFDNGYNHDTTIPKTNYYKDFNIQTEQFGEQNEIKININNVETTLTQIVMRNYLNNQGVSAGFAWGCIMTCRPIKKGDYWYMAITSCGTDDGSSLVNGGQPIVFVRSSDAFAHCEILGVLDINNYYECQIEWDDDLELWHILTRHATYISYCTTSDFTTFSSETDINSSIGSRPQILKYKNGILFVTNKVNNTMDGEIGGVSEIHSRSRIVGQMLNASNINESPVVFDFNSPFGIVYPSIANLNGLLYMTYNNGKKMTQLNNDGKLAIQYYEFGELESDITGYLYKNS